MGVLIWDVSSLMMHGVCPERRRRGGNIAVGAAHGKCNPICSNRRAVGRWDFLPPLRGSIGGNGLFGGDVCPWGTPVRGFRLSASPTAVC